MEPDLLQIDEVVVTAMGIRKEKKALGYSVQELNETDISGAKNMDISKSLQGKIAGVIVKQSSGMPGATSHVTIRGNVSLTGSNQPLYVVDGMPIASDKAFSENVGEGTNPSSRILDLNPEDIESMLVLKGSTASALYGLRAANGVIVITTKSGSAARIAGKKTLVTVNSSFSSDQVSRLPELQSTYGQGNGGVLNLWSSGSWGPRIDTLQNYQSQEENLYFDNPYIVLVFLAARTVRDWYQADNKQKELQQFKLQQQMEETMTKVQPQMLLYAIDHIDRMVDRSSPDVTDAIALTSELLSEVMMYHEEEQHLFSREIELIKKLVSLVTLFRESKPEVEFFISGDSGHIKLPPMILFSFVDLIFRKFEEATMIPELSIEASGFSNMITIQVLLDGVKKHAGDLEECMQSLQQMESFYQGKVSITHEAHSYGCSVIIRNNDPGGVNTIHTFPDVVGMV